MDNNYFCINNHESSSNAEIILSKLNKDEIKEKAKKYKKNQTISMSILGIITFIAFTILFCCLPLISEGEPITLEILIICIIVAIFTISFPFILLFFTLRKPEHSLAILQIEKENLNNDNIYRNININNKHISDKYDKIIIKNFYSNKPLLNKLIVPAFQFAESLGISNYEIVSFVRDAFDFHQKSALTFESLLKYVKPFLHKSYVKIESKLWKYYNFSDAQKILSIFMEVNLNQQIFHLSEYDELKLNSLKQTLIKLQDNIKIQNAVNEYLNKQFKMSFIKIFFYEKQLLAIENNEELLKILTNAIHKYRNLDAIADNTYELFLDYYNLSNYQFSKDLYCELLMVLILKIKECRDYYNAEDLPISTQLYENNNDIIFNDIVNKNLYKSYEIEKLIKGIVYEKLIFNNDLLNTVNDILLIEKNINTLKKLKLKEDLLNDDYQNKITTIEDIDLMSGIQFENFLCNYFKNMGYSCNTTKTSGDQGVDLIATQGNNKIAIQAKCYYGNVGNHAIMEVIAGSKFYGANTCMVITNSYFTKSAKELAKANCVILWDRKTLIEKLKAM